MNFMHDMLRLIYDIGKYSKGKRLQIPTRLSVVIEFG